MKEKKASQKWLQILCLALIVFCAGWTIYSMVTTSGVGPMVTIQNILILCSLAAAFLYCLSGYNKSEAGYYKTYLWVCTAKCFGSILLTKDFGLVILGLGTIIFGAMCILASGKDLGKKMSLALCAICFAANLIITMIMCIGSRSVFPQAVSTMLLSVLLYFVVSAKYADKEARGTT